VKKVARKRTKKKKTKKSRRQLYGDRYIEASVRRYVTHRDDNKCVYCGKRGRKKGWFRDVVKLEFGHAIPHSKRGDVCINNIQLECFSCNRSKGATVDEVSWVKRLLFRGAKGCARKCKDKMKKN
jgi:5-methylcytosine-specific restriction endonuclease McrA